MPPALPLIIAGIQAAIQAAPAVESVIVAAKEWISSLVGSGVIPADKQDELNDWVDETVDAFLAGNPPPEFLVEPDPTGDVPPAPAQPS